MTAREIETGETQTHAKARLFGYDTLCGVECDGDLFEKVPIPPKQKITCAQCLEIWEAARTFRRSDFTTERTT